MTKFKRLFGRIVDDMSVLLLIGAMLLFTAATAFSDTASLTVASGKAGGGYDKASRVYSQRLLQRGIPNTVHNLNGSDEISLALC